MISRKLIAALVGLTLVAGTVAEASATVSTGQIATKSVATKSVAATTTTPRVRKVAAKHHRLHVSHRAIKHMKVVKATGGKRLALSHATKRVAQKHA